MKASGNERLRRPKGKPRKVHDHVCVPMFTLGGFRYYVMEQVCIICRARKRYVYRKQLAVRERGFETVGKPSIATVCLMDL